MTTTQIGGGWSTGYGTSFSSAMAAGCGALLQEAHPEWSADEIEAALEASPIRATDTTNGLSFPRVDCLEALGPGGGGVSCSEITKFQARCQSGGKVQFRIILESTASDGETVLFKIDGGNDHVATAVNGKAQGSQNGYSLGTHVVSLADPAGCVSDKIVTCQ
jgi:hypothetical protein